jgi:hypothetical protein
VRHAAPTRCEAHHLAGVNVRGPAGHIVAVLAAFRVQAVQGSPTAIPLFFAPPRDPAVTRWCLEQQRLFPVGAHPRARKAITSFAHNARMQSP